MSKRKSSKKRATDDEKKASKKAKSDEYLSKLTDLGDAKLSKADQDLLDELGGDSWCKGCKAKLPSNEDLIMSCRRCRNSFHFDTADSHLTKDRIRRCVVRCGMCTCYFCSECMANDTRNRFTEKQLEMAGYEHDEDHPLHEFPHDEKGTVLCCTVCSAGIREFLRHEEASKKKQQKKKSDSNTKSKA